MSEQQTIDQRVAEIDEEVESFVASVGGREAIQQDRALWTEYCEIRMQEHELIESAFPAAPKEVGALIEAVETLRGIVENLHYVTLNRDSVVETWNVFCTCDEEFPKRDTGKRSHADPRTNRTAPGLGQGRFVRFSRSEGAVESVCLSIASRPRRLDGPLAEQDALMSLFIGPFRRGRVVSGVVP